MGVLNRHFSNLSILLQAGPPAPPFHVAPLMVATYATPRKMSVAFIQVSILRASRSLPRRAQGSAPVSRRSPSGGLDSRSKAVALKGSNARRAFAGRARAGEILRTERRSLGTWPAPRRIAGRHDVRDDVGHSTPDARLALNGSWPPVRHSGPQWAFIYGEKVELESGAWRQCRHFSSVRPLASAHAERGSPTSLRLLLAGQEAPGSRGVGLAEAGGSEQDRVLPSVDLLRVAPAVASSHRKRAGDASPRSAPPPPIGALPFESGVPPSRQTPPIANRYMAPTSSCFNEHTTSFDGSAHLTSTLALLPSTRRASCALKGSRFDCAAESIRANEFAQLSRKVFAGAHLARPHDQNTPSLISQRFYCSLSRLTFAANLSSKIERSSLAWKRVYTPHGDANSIHVRRWLSFSHGKRYRDYPAAPRHAYRNHIPMSINNAVPIVPVPCFAASRRTSFDWFLAMGPSAVRSIRMTKTFSVGFLRFDLFVLSRYQLAHAPGSTHFDGFPFD